MQTAYMPGQKARNPWLDALRVLAIALVIVCHGTNFFAGPQWVTTVTFETGLLGVELFFVLSGFLVGGILLEHFASEQPVQAWIIPFYIRRWRRTLPNYYLFLVVAIALEFFCYGKLSSDVWPYLFLLQNFAWTIPNLYMQSWSLPVEEFFYLIMPLLLWFVPRRRLSWNAHFIQCCIGLATLSFVLRSGAALSSTSPSFNLGIREVVIYRLDSFMIGVMAYYTYRSWRHTSHLTFVAVGVLAIGLCALAVAEIFGDLDQSAFWKIVWPPLSSVGCAALLLAFVDRVVIPRVVQGAISLVARWSYSMYLANSPIVIGMLTWVPRGPLEPLSHKWLLFAIYVATTTLVGWATFKWFETPMMTVKLPTLHLLRRHLSARIRRA